MKITQLIIIIFVSPQHKMTATTLYKDVHHRKLTEQNKSQSLIVLIVDKNMAFLLVWF